MFLDKNECDSWYATLAARENKSLITVAPDVYWVGAVDFKIRDFHGYKTREGSSYNSFLIMGENPTLVDSVKTSFAPTLLANILAIVPLHLVRYVVCNHAEPDHSSSLPAVMSACNNAQLLCTKKCHEVLKKIFHPITYASQTYNLSAPASKSVGSGDAASWPVYYVSSGQTFSLGNPGHHLWFMDTPMVHWPESMFTYLIEKRVLFSIDGFGQHLASIERFDDECMDHTISGEVTVDHVIEAARSYFANILMPYGLPISKVLSKFVESLPAVDATNSEFNLSQEPHGMLPRVLATAHGVIWRKNVPRIVELYQKWASHECKTKVLIVYDTMYGSTEKIARAMFQGAREYRCPKTARGATILLRSLRETHMTVIAEDCLDSACLAWGSCNLNNEIFPPVAQSLTYIAGLRPSRRYYACFGSYGWNATAIPKKITEVLEGQLKLTKAAEPLFCNYQPTDDILKKAHEIGLLLAQLAFTKAVD